MRRWDIHLLRAVAILSVFGYHSGVPNMHGGSLGVDVFFVLSGYLITAALLRESALTRTGLATFYRKRLARTVPAALVTILAVTVAALVVAPEQWDTMRWHLAASLTWTENLLVTSAVAGDLQGVSSLTPFTHFWSLAMEEQFYLVWPWLLVASLAIGAVLLRARRLVAGGVLAGVILVSLSWYVTWGAQADTHAIAYFSPLSRVWQLGAGALVALALPTLTAAVTTRRWVGPASIAAFGAGVVVLVRCFTEGGFARETDSPWWGVAVVVTTALLLITGRWIPSLRPGVERWLAPVMAVGTVSYGLYLWHLPVLWVVAELGLEKTPGWWLMVVGTSLALAGLSWHLVEKPTMALARRRREPIPAPAPEPATQPDRVLVGV